MSRDGLANPNGCRECGRDQSGHGLSYSERISYHNWIEPTQEQRLTRMRQRAEARNGRS